MIERFPLCASTPLPVSITFSRLFLSRTATYNSGILISNTQAFQFIAEATLLKRLWFDGICHDNIIRLVGVQMEVSHGSFCKEADVTALSLIEKSSRNAKTVEPVNACMQCD